MFSLKYQQLFSSFPPRIAYYTFNSFNKIVVMRMKTDGSNGSTINPTLPQSSALLVFECVCMFSFIKMCISCTTIKKNYAFYFDSCKLWVTLAKLIKSLSFFLFSVLLSLPPPLLRTLKVRQTKLSCFKLLLCSGGFVLLDD